MIVECSYSHLFQAASRSVRFSEGSHGFDISIHDHVQITLEGVEIFPTEYPYRFLHRAPDSWDTRQIVKKIDCAERQDRPETTKHSNKVGDSDTGARGLTAVSSRS